MIDNALSQGLIESEIGGQIKDIKKVAPKLDDPQYRGQTKETCNNCSKERIEKQ